MTIGSTISVKISPGNIVLVNSLSINANTSVVRIRIPQRTTAASAAKRLIFFFK